MLTVVVDPLAEERAYGELADSGVVPDPDEVVVAERADELEALGPEREEPRQQLGRVAFLVAARGRDLRGLPILEPGGSPARMTRIRPANPRRSASTRCPTHSLADHSSGAGRQ
jgi:hypothetical protein